MRVAIIPARGGSKRIPRKNIKDFFGKPMIAWSIEAAKASDCFDKIVVSTDDGEIARVAENWGAEVPFIRPLHLSDDHTGTIAVIRHAVHWLECNQVLPSSVCCIYATAPFLSPSDLRTGLNILKKGNIDYAVAVTTYRYPIQRSLMCSRHHMLEMREPEHFNTRSQDLTTYYHDAGQFYWGESSTWLTGKEFFNGRSAPVLLPSYRVQDIDTDEDWECAEKLFSVVSRSDIQ